MTDLFETPVVEDESLFEEVTPLGNSSFKKSNSWEANEKLQGVFLGTYKSYGPPEKPFDNPVNNHRVMTKLDGTVVHLNGCTSMDNYFGAIKPGSYVLVSYEGTRVIESGKNAGKEAFVFRVNAVPDAKAATNAGIQSMFAKAATLPAFDEAAAQAKPAKPKQVIAGDLEDLFTQDESGKPPVV